MCYGFFTLILISMIKKNLQFEVTIIGGGVAGVNAAIAAARNGAKTLLINSSPVLGGNSSSEIRVWTRGSSGGGNIFSEEMGILGELKLRNQYINQKLSPIIWDEVLLEAVKNEKNITLLLNTLVVSAAYEDNSIKSIEAFSVRGEAHYFINSNIFVDASGDGIIASATDIDFVIGKESQDEYNEEYAPIKPSLCTQGSSILFFTEEKDEKVKFIAPSFAYSIEVIDSLINNDGRIVNEKTNGLDFWWVEYGGDVDMFTQANEVAFELKKIAYGIFNYIKNSGLYDADNLDLVWIGNIPGKRESRRFKTDTILTYNDIKNKKVFDDVAFYGGWFLDFHPEGGIYSTEQSCIQIPVGIYPIPLSSLYSSKVKNLLLCGRIIGTTHSSFASTRIMDTCALSGQAAGTAAAYLSNNNKITSDLNKDYQKVQEQLEDMLLINKEPKIVDKDITINVNSTISKVPGKEIGSLKGGDKEIFLTVDYRAIESSKIIIDALEDTTISVKKREDILPHRFDIAYSDEKEIYLNKGRNSISLSDYKSNKPCFITLKFKTNEKVSFPTLDENLPGFLLGYIKNPKYYNPYIVLDDFSYLSKDNLLGGYNRPYNGYNAWTSNSIDCEIKLKSKNKFDLLKIYFDPSLERELVSSRQLKVNESHMIDEVFGVAKSLVKDFNIIPYSNNQELETIEIRNNYQRLVKINFSEEIDSLIIKFINTWGEKRIRIFNIEIENKKRR